jgi:hypothetical protein
VLVEARVDHHLAKRAPAFSVGGRIIDYKIDEDSATATITRAEITEISLTDRPAPVASGSGSSRAGPHRPHQWTNDRPHALS